jgi:GntR family transcriptional regulator
MAGPEPLYEQLKLGIRHAILRGDLHEGDPVPSFRGFAAELRVSVITVKRAYDDLVAEGVLAARQGRGTFVAVGAEESCRQAARKEVEELLRRAREVARLAGMSDPLNPPTPFSHGGEKGEVTDTHTPSPLVGEGVGGEGIQSTVGEGSVVCEGVGGEGFCESVRGYI